MVRGSILLAALFAVSFLAGSTQACNRCGHRVCRIVKHVPVVKVIERVPLDQSDRSINVTYNIKLDAPAAREGLTSYRNYAQEYDPLSSGLYFNFDEWRRGAQEYQQLAASHAERSDARVASVVESIARIKGHGLGQEVQLRKLQLMEKLLADDNALELLLRVKGQTDVLGDEPSRDLEQPEVSDIPPMVTASCVRCHSGDAPRGGLDFSDPSVVSAQAEKMLEAVMKDRMPLDDEQKPVPLSPLDKLAFGNQLFAKD